MTLLFFDTETNGLPRDYSAPATDVDNWPRLTQIGYRVHKPDGKLIKSRMWIVKPDGFEIDNNSEAAKITGITQERAMSEGIDLHTVLTAFNDELKKASFLIAHNIRFDQKVIHAEFIRAEIDTHSIYMIPKICTMRASTNFCQLPTPRRRGTYKWPTNEELHIKLFGKGFEGAHDAEADIAATARNFFELVKQNVIVLPDLQTQTEAQPVEPDKDGKTINPADEKPQTLNNFKNKNPLLMYKKGDEIIFYRRSK